MFQNTPKCDPNHSHGSNFNSSSSSSSSRVGYRFHFMNTHSAPSSHRLLGRWLGKSCQSQVQGLCGGKARQGSKAASQSSATIKRPSRPGRPAVPHCRRQAGQQVEHAGMNPRNFHIRTHCALLRGRGIITHTHTYTFILPSFPKKPMKSSRT